LRYIYKYVLGPRYHVYEVTLPEKATLLSVGTCPKTGCPCVWAEVEPQALTEVRRFLTVPTGGLPGDHRWSFLGTVISPSGLVVHIYVEKEKAS
jgi:hypothetical protein